MVFFSSDARACSFYLDPRNTIPPTITARSACLIKIRGNSYGALPVGIKSYHITFITLVVVEKHDILLKRSMQSSVGVGWIGKIGIIQ